MVWNSENTNDDEKHKTTSTTATSWATTTTTTTTCPYAVKLHYVSIAHHKNEHEEDSSTTTVTSHESHSEEGGGGGGGQFPAWLSSSSSSVSWQQPPAWQAAIQTCPAFQQGTCPFRNAQSAQDVQQTLLQVPASHLETSAQFYKVLQEMHQVNRQLLHQDQDDNTAKAASTPIQTDNDKGGGGCGGGLIAWNECPVQALVQKETHQSNVSFTEAVEGMSLSAIMVRLAQDLEQHKQQQQQLQLKSKSSPQRQRQHTHRRGRSETTLGQEETTMVPIKDHELSSSGNLRRVSSTGSLSSLRLSETLKSGTADSHQAAENVHFVRDFVRGKINARLYAQLVLNLYHVYNTLEALLDQHAPRLFPSCHFPTELARTHTLLADIEYWYADPKQAMARPPTEATQDYMERLHELAQKDDDALLLLAHSYTRYLGDLSGGRVLARVARKALQLEAGPGCGLDFYQFNHIDSPKCFKDQFRQALDALPLTDAQVQALVAEANVAFGLNMRLFEELDVQAGLPGAKVRPLQPMLQQAATTAAVATLQQQEKQQEQPSKPLSSSSSSSSKTSTAAAAANACPFANLARNSDSMPMDHHHHHHRPLPQQQQAPAKKHGAGRCPWPFVLLHDPITGMKDWKTWATVAIVVAIVLQMEQ